MDGSRDHIPNVRRPRVAIALGGGGARGIAHVLALEALDEVGIRPVANRRHVDGRCRRRRLCRGNRRAGHSDPHIASFAQPLRRHGQAFAGTSRALR